MSDPIPWPNNLIFTEVNGRVRLTTTSYCGQCAGTYLHVVGSPWDPRCCDYAIKQNLLGEAARRRKTKYEQRTNEIS